MTTPNDPALSNPQPQGQSSNQEQTPSRLTLSTYIREIDDQARQNQLQMQFQQPNNIAGSQKNTRNQIQSFCKVQRHLSSGTQPSNQKIPQPRNEEIKNYPQPFVKVKQAEKVNDFDPNDSNARLEIKKRQETSQASNLDQNDLLAKPVQQKNSKLKGLGQKIVNSLIIKPANRNADMLGPVDQQSVVLPQNDEEDSIPHFQAASFDTSEESVPQFQQSKANQNNILIKVTQHKDNSVQKLPQHTFNKNPVFPRIRIQAQPSAQQAYQSNRAEDQKKKIIYNHMQNPQESANHKRPNRNNNEIESKMTCSRFITTEPVLEKEIPIQSQKNQASEKRVIKIEVSNRMKSTYDPVGKKTQFKLGNLSEPDKRQSKVSKIKEKQEIQLFDESQSEAQKVQKNEKQKIQSAIIMKLQTITKQISQKMANISEPTPPANELPQIRKQDLQDQQYKKPSKHKIEIMKNLVPEQLFNGFSSIETNQREKKLEKQENNKLRHTEYSSFIVQQIQSLKKQIKELEKVSTKRQLSRDQIKVKRVNSDKNNFSTFKKISINYKDYNQTSLAKLVNKKNTTSLIKKDISSEISFSQDEFVQLQALMSVFKKTPKPDHSPQELADLSLYVMQKLGINADLYGYMDLTRFKQGVQFELNDGPTLIWHYDGQMYLGQTSNRRQGVLQLQGEGILIIPKVSCYKGMFSKGKKSGPGIYLTAKGEKYKGDWKNDCYHGRGKLNGESSIYEGSFQKGMKQGEGTEIFNNGDIYEGEYQEGKFHGRGRYCWKNKTVYVGEFNMGFMEGEGLWRSRKDTYKGQYYKNMKHGYGVYQWGNGKIYEGKFQHGRRVSKLNPKKPTIAVEREITCDLQMELSSQSQSETYEIKLKKTGFNVGKRFTIQSREESPVQRKKGSRFNLVKQ